MGILNDEMAKHKAQIWAYCLMDNHVHFVAVPEKEDSLAKLFREAHKRYARMINEREGWRGHLWQERFHSFVMDERHLYAAMRYVERNPVKAKMVKKAEDYHWSSAEAHVRKIHDPLLSSCYLMDEIKDWEDYLHDDRDDETFEKQIHKHSTTGRPLGSDEFIQKLEEMTGKVLQKKKAGRVVGVANTSDLIMINK